MATRNHNYTIDLDKPLSRQNMGLLLATGDSKGDVFNFDLTRSGKAEALSGTVTVAGYFIRNDTATVAMYGSYSGNRVSVTLPASCYIEDGYFTLAVRVTAGGAKTTIAVIDGYIRLTTTNTLIDPGAVVPTLDDVLNQIAEMEAVTAEGEATIAAIRADTDAVIENTNKATAATIAATVELAETAAPAITPTVSGSIVSITDGADRPAVQVISHIEPVQEGSGDPSPDNVRPISGWDNVTAQRTGKNLANISETLTFVQGSTNRIGIPAGSYIVSCTNASTTGEQPPVAEFQDKNGLVVAIVSELTRGLAKTVNLDRDVAKIVFYANGYSYSNSAGHSATIEQFMVSKTEGAYEPYQAQTLTADLPETVYGGTLDWGTGVLTSDFVFRALDGSEGWKSIDPDNQVSNFYYLKIEELNTAVAGKHNKCSHLGIAEIKLATNNIGFNVVNSPSYNMDMMVARPDLTLFPDVASWKAYLAEQYAAGTPVAIAYKVAEPYTIQLTPQQLSTLKGTNNVWSNTGDTDLTYIADTQMYIDNKFDELNAAILSQGANV